MGDKGEENGSQDIIDSKSSMGGGLSWSWDGTKGIEGEKVAMGGRGKTSKPWGFVS